MPVPAADAVLIRVRAAAINKGDWHLTTGQPFITRLAFGLRRPKAPIAGQEMAGVIEAVGKNVTQFRAGDAVFGELRGGAFAEFACTTENRIVRMPANLTFAEAATMPTAVTALQGLRDCAKIKPGQHVLIVGASGGVGTFAVQLAKAYGATVTAVCSAGNADMVRAIGADHVIDYTREDFSDGGARFDVLFDLVGNRALRDCRRALKRDGVYVAAAGGSGKWLAPIPRLIRMQLSSPFVPQRMAPLLPPEDLKPFFIELLDPIERGAITPVIGRRCTLRDVPAILHEQGGGHTRGKTVIDIFDADGKPSAPARGNVTGTI